MRSRVGAVLGLLLWVVACDAGPDRVPSRGLLDADGVLGSCENACGEAALQGNCWCDASCVDEDDCCSDKVDVCGGGGPVDPQPALCLDVQDCPAGLTCDTSACFSACRDADGCEDACVGMCVEPRQQSLPDPDPDPDPDPGGDEPDDAPGDDTDTEDEPDVECDCPEGDLCVPLCPVCPPEVADEDCQCAVVCVSF